MKYIYDDMLVICEKNDIVVRKIKQADAVSSRRQFRSIVFSMVKTLAVAIVCIQCNQSISTVLD